LEQAEQERIRKLRSLPFAALHAACLLVFWSGVSPAAVAACIFLYYIRMFGITAGYHRYFSHMSFKTGRAFQFVLAWLGASSMQKGVLWWAAHHRHHHTYSDEEDDIHSPVRRGFWWSHVGWILCAKYDETRWDLVRNFARYGELVWLNKFHVVPGLLLGAKVYLFGWLLERYAPALGVTAFQMLIWGFVVSTVLLYHGTFAINSLTHIFGSRRFPTPDNSRNNLLFALLTMGEGWHNNHHYYPASARMGFRWWEVDLSHYALTVLSWCGVVWDLKRPPGHALGRPRAAPPARSRQTAQQENPNEPSTPLIS